MSSNQDKQEKITTFCSSILDWFKEHGKSYPWRKTTSPYEIMIAEMFLQRTQAKQVVPIFQRFLERFPFPVDLAAADVSEIEQLVSPLGLKKKAKHLKQTATQITEQYNSQVPSDVRSLMRLQGIGPYTTNAILVFAFGCRMPLVDANVVRLLTRVFGLNCSNKRPRTDPAFWEFAKTILPRESVAKYTWGLIDFSNTICKPRQPDCLLCPIKCVCSFGTKEQLQIGGLD